MVDEGLGKKQTTWVKGKWQKGTTSFWPAKCSQHFAEELHKVYFPDTFTSSKPKHLHQVKCTLDQSPHLR